jgi:hypothetical protein
VGNLPLVFNMAHIDVILPFIAQLEARDKFNKILQNLFRALKGAAKAAGKDKLAAQFHEMSWTFESARLAGWVGKFLFDVRGIQQMLLSGTITTLISTVSAPTKSVMVFDLLLVSRISMGIRWFLEQVRLAARLKCLPESLKNDEQLWNVRAKYFWVTNCAFGFLAEAVRLAIMTRDPKRAGGTKFHALVCLVFYFFDCHASVTLTDFLPKVFGIKNMGDGHVGSMMIIASLIQWYCMYPTIPLAMKRAVGNN